MLFLVCALMLICSPAMAGKNADGALLVHTDDAVNYTFFAPPDYCAEFETMDLMDCVEFNTSSNFVDPNGLLGALIYLVAYFHPGSSPGVTVIFFGIEHNLAPGLIAGWDFCGPPNSLEIPDAGWPQEWETAGNSLAFGSPIAGDLIFPFYWFGVYGDAGNFIGTGINPTGGYAGFVSDDNPGVLDEIFLFGYVEWFGPGHNDCDGPPVDACCFPDGSCTLEVPGVCYDLGGIPWGVPFCEPNPCPQPWACCFEDGTCVMLTEEDCYAAGGTFWGPGIECEPINPCEPVIGACCDPNGRCELAGEIECGENLWLEGEVCEPNPCPQPEACCFEDESCEYILVDECVAIGGEPQGEGTDCDPNPCIPIPVDETTFGSIKAVYR
jgi:hypothetical protein